MFSHSSLERLFIFFIINFSNTIMYRDQQNGIGKGLLVGFFIGGVVGAVTALLLAPKSGRELRDDLRSKADDAVRKFSDTAARAKDFAQNITDESNDVFQESNELFDETVGHAEKITDAFRAGYDAYREERERS